MSNRAPRSIRPFALRAVAVLALSACGGDKAAKPATGSPDAGETSPIEIVVDDSGVPHVYADSDLDLFFGYGYQLAKDRLFQLEMFRRSGLGRRAEVLGKDFPGAVVDTALTEDRLLRMLDIRRWATEDAKITKEKDPERYALIEAWKDGINHRIQEVTSGKAALPFGFGPSELDFEPEPWSDVDPFVTMKMARFVMDNTLLYEILVTVVHILNPKILDEAQIFKPATTAFSVPPETRPPADTRTAFADPGRPYPNASPGPEFAAALPLLLQYASVLRDKAGSNNWAVSGDHTDNGKPLIAGDPHLPFNAAGVPYAIHLDSKTRGKGGTFDVEGFAFTATPGILAGHNERVVWTPTSAFSDTMDMWDVPVSGDQVTVGNQTVTLQRRDESIPVKGADPFPNTYRDVPGYGVIFDSANAGVPIPLAAANHEIMLNWTGLKGSRPGWFLELNRAESVDDFEQALTRTPDLNFMYVFADAKSIAIKNGVEEPARKPIATTREPWRSMDGTDPDSFWTGDILSYDQLPHGRDPAQGFVFSANNDPLGFTENGNAADDAYYYGAFFDPGWRGHRIESELTRLTAAGKVTLDDVQKLQMDTHSNDADDMLPLLDAAWTAVATDPALSTYRGRTDLATLVTALDGWDRKMVRTSHEAVVFHALMHHVTMEIYLDEPAMSAVYDRILNAATFFGFKLAIGALRGDYPNGDALLQGGKNPTILRALDKTAKYLTDRFGSSDPSTYTFGDIHRTNFDGSYGMGMPIAEDATDGGETSIAVSQDSKFLGGTATDPARSQYWVSSYGPVERTTGRFLDDGTPETYVQMPVGNVADKASPHFRDGFEGWRDGTYRKMLFSRDEVDQKAESRMTLVRGADAGL